MTPTRFKVLYYYLFNNKNHVTHSELINFFFDRSYSQKAKSTFRKIEKDNSWYKVYFKDLPNDQPLYFPLQFDLKSLEQVVVESFYPTNWHYYETEETGVRINDTVVDCGAAEGLFSYMIADRCKEVYLVEPMKKFVDGYAHTFSNRNNVNFIEKAISDQSSKAFLSDNGIASQINNKEGTVVEVTTLDELFFEKNIPVTYIKIDLEGFDYLALKGGINLIKKHKPRIAVTTYHQKEHADQISKLLVSINPDYQIKTKGIYQETGSPVMLHAWVD